MKVLFIGAETRSGTSKKTGKPYSMGFLHYAVPHQPKQTPDYDFRAVGMRVIEVEMELAALSQFSQVKPFTEIDVALEPRPENPSRNSVTGLVR